MKRIILLSHCVLNSMCEEPPADDSYRRCIVEAALKNDISMIQLPCPELCYQALTRESIYPGTEKAGPYEDYCRELLAPLVGNFREYKKHGIELAAVIGINTSPSCSVEASDSIMMKVMVEELKNIGYDDFRCLDMPVKPGNEEFCKAVEELL